MQCSVENQVPTLIFIDICESNKYFQNAMQCNGENQVLLLVFIDINVMSQHKYFQNAIQYNAKQKKCMRKA